MLPIIAGIAFGSLTVIAINNKAKIKEVAISGLDKGIDKSKNILENTKKLTKEKVVNKISKNTNKSKTDKESKEC